MRSEIECDRTGASIHSKNNWNYIDYDIKIVIKIKIIPLPMNVLEITVSGV